MLPPKLYRMRALSRSGTIALICKLYPEENLRTMSTDDIKNEFRNLGENLKQTANAAWTSEERQRLQKEIMDGISELGDALKDLGVQVQESEVTQKFKEDMEDLGDQVRSGEIQENARAGVVSALQRVNSELENLIDKWTPGKSEKSESDSA